MQEGYRVVHGLPLRQVGVVQVLLAGVGVRPLEACLHSLWRLKSVLDGGLQQVDGVFGVHLCRQPQAEVVVDLLCLQHALQQLIQEVQGQVRVLQESPASLCGNTEGERGEEKESL